jgi:hypothetical protein
MRLMLYIHAAAWHISTGGTVVILLLLCQMQQQLPPNKSMRPVVLAEHSMLMAALAACGMGIFCSTRTPL